MPIKLLRPKIGDANPLQKKDILIHSKNKGRDNPGEHPIKAIDGLEEVLEELGNLSKENITGLKTADTPEFANTQITTLKTAADAGIVPALQATWLNATAKSVLSYLVNILSKLYTHITATANAHPATAITVDEDPVANFNKVAKDDTGQVLANKLLGVQENVVHEVVLSADITEFEVTGLDLSNCEIVIKGVSSFTYNAGYIEINNNAGAIYWNSVTNTTIISFLLYAGGTVDTNFAGRLLLNRNSANEIVYNHIIGGTGSTGVGRTVTQTGFVPITANITSIRMWGLNWRAGTSIKIYKL